jgi:hypothetical protein
LFHEAGHPILGIFGNQFLASLGGTIGQLAFPIGLMIAFLIKEQILSASVMFFWAGQNLFGISIYMKDAQARVLPLIGGELHDWWYMFSQMHVLQYDQLIGNCVWLIGLAVVVTASLMGIQAALTEVYVADEDKKEAEFLKQFNKK